MNDQMGEPTITEVEPGLWELTIQHGDHIHGLRAKDEPGYPGKGTLESSARATRMLFERGELDCQNR